MAGFDDLIAEASPYLDVEEIEKTQRTTWEWSYFLEDYSGALVDMTTGYTGTCNIRVQNGTADIVTPAVSFPSPGEVRVGPVTPTASAVDPGRYFHEVTIIRTSDGAAVVVVGAGDSVLVVKKKVGP